MTQKNLADALEWAEAARVLAEARADERRKRDALVASCFAKGSKGTVYVDLPKGYRLKLVQRSNYDLDPALTRKAEAALRAKGPAEALLADRLFRWSPEISIREYLKLPADLAKLVKKALTITPSAPALELIEPS